MNNGKVVDPRAKVPRPSPQVTNRGHQAARPTAQKQVAAATAHKAPKTPRVRLTTILNLAVAPGCILFGHYIGSRDISSLLQNGSALIVAALIVIGGTLGSCIVSLPPASLRAALRDMRAALFRSAPNSRDLTERVVNYSTILRTEGQTALQQYIGKEPSSMLATGLTMIVSNIAPEAINTMLERALPERARLANTGAEVFEKAAAYLPRLGILGAMLGLSYATMMRFDPAKVGFGITTAFAASVYGVAMVFLAASPIARKIRARAVNERQLDKIAVIGVKNIRLPAQALRQLLAGGGNPPASTPQGSAHLKVGSVNARS